MLTLIQDLPPQRIPRHFVLGALQNCFSHHKEWGTLELAKLQRILDRQVGVTP